MFTFTFRKIIVGPRSVSEDVLNSKLKMNFKTRTNFPLNDTIDKIRVKTAYGFKITRN